MAILLGSLPGWIDSAAIILTVFLLWFGFSQIGLFLHGLTAWRGGIAGYLDGYRFKADGNQV